MGTMGMAVFVTWADDARTLIHLRYSGAWTWAEYLESKQHLLHMAAQVEHPIDIISYAEPDSLHPPTGMIANFSKGMAMLPPNTHIMVVVTDHAFMNAAASLMPRVRPVDPRLRAVGTLEEAFALVEAHRGAGV